MQLQHLVAAGTSITCPDILVQYRMRGNDGIPWGTENGVSALGEGLKEVAAQAQKTKQNKQQKKESAEP